LAYHNLQLEAAAFREEFDPEEFEDLTLPNYRAIHEVKPTMGVFAIISLMIN
jgi:ATP-dependent DNA helicase 2 subunit 1